MSCSSSSSSSSSSSELKKLWKYLKDLGYSTNSKAKIVLNVDGVIQSDTMIVCNHVTFSPLLLMF